MPHFFLVLSVNGSGPNSLSGGNDSGKFGNSGVDALALFGGAVAGLGSSIHPQRRDQETTYLAHHGTICRIAVQAVQF